MKTLRQYEQSLIQDDLATDIKFLESLDQINEGLFAKLKKLILGKNSWMAKMYKTAHGDEKDIIKATLNDKELANLTGREFWDHYFTKIAKEYKDAWFEINPTDKERKNAENEEKRKEKKEKLKGKINDVKDKIKSKFNKNEDDNKNESLIDQYDILFEKLYLFTEDYLEESLTDNEINILFSEEFDNYLNNEEIIIESDEAKSKLLFSDDKIAKYSEYDGMIPTIVNGLTYMYDVAKTLDGSEAKERINYVKTNLKLIQNSKSLKSEDKKYVNDAISELEELVKTNKDNAENNNENNGNATPEEIKDTNKKIETTSKALGGDTNKIKKALKNIIPIDKTEETNNESLESQENVISEAKIELPEELQSFKDDYILGRHKVNDKQHGIKDKEQRTINKQAIIQIVSSISSALENMKDNDSNTIEKETLFTFLKALLDYKDFTKVI